MHLHHVWISMLFLIGMLANHLWFHSGRPKSCRPAYTVQTMPLMLNRQHTLLCTNNCFAAAVSCVISHAALQQPQTGLFQQQQAVA